MSTITADKGAVETTGSRRGISRTILEWGGFAAGAVLIVFGVVAIVMGFSGHSTVGDGLKQEKIVGSADMTPAAIKEEAQKAGLNLDAIDLPTKSVAGQTIDTGPEARTFATYMRIHTLEATQGLTYAEMGRFVAKPGTPKAQLTPDGATNNSQYAQIDSATKQPVASHARDIWVTETALTTALNTSFMADRLAVFGVVVGVALLLSGIGFIVLSFAVLHRRRPAAAS
jgi:hypothetical protein